MLAISSEHPDLPEFINIKNDLQKLNHANLSVMASDAFMNAVVLDRQHTLSFTRDTGTKLEIVVNANELFKDFVKNNYNTGEPGILFWDTVKGHSMLSEHPEFKLECVNPCAELALPAFGACNLGSFNLVEYAYKDLDTYLFNFEEFEKDIYIAVKAMNAILDEGLPLHPLKEQKEAVAKWRMIGIGVMSFADLLIKMGYKYGDQTSLDLASEIAITLLNTSVKASALLAKKYGAYPGYNGAAVTESKFFKENLSEPAQKLVREYGLRNATLLSIAPTGSISTLLGCSNGIEPIFAEKCKRRTESLHKKAVTYEVYSSVIQEVVNNLGIKDGEPLPEYIITSMNIPPINRIKMQGIWQQFVDSSISSTINLPNTATEKDIYAIYIEAWRYGLKGVTVFRDGCKREGILTTNEPQKIEVDYKAPDITFGPQDRVSVACGHFLCAVTGVGEQPSKVVNSATTGCCDANLHAIQRLCSLALRSGVSPELITKQLDKVVCKACMNNPKATSKSCAAGISKVIKLYDRFYKAVGPINLDQSTIKPMDADTKLVECPECHEKSFQTAKCFTCSNCGYSRCS